MQRATAAGGTPTGSRWPACDGLRALAVSMVVAYHVTTVLAFPSVDPTVLRWATQLGPQGVAIFFALSGFLLARPFLAAQLGGRATPSVTAFWVRRAARIYPAYWVALAVTVYVVQDRSFADRGEAAAAFALVQGYRRGSVFAGLGVAWTLVVEVTFYALLPLLVAVPFVAVARRRGVALARAHVVWSGALVAGAFAVRGWWLWSYSPSPTTRGAWFSPVDLPISFPWFADVFAIGILIALASAWRDVRGTLPRPLDVAPRWALCWTGAGAGYALLAQMRLGGRGNPPSRALDVFVAAPLRATIAGLVLLPIALGPGAPRATLDRVLRARPVVALGLVSYGVFLWHLTFVRRVGRWADAGSFPSALAVEAASAVAVSLGVAAASYWVLERPLIDGMRRLQRRRSPARRPAPGVLVDARVEP